MPYFSADDSIPKLLEACARDRPEHLWCRADDGHTLTYDALNRRVNRLAHGFYDVGVRPGTHVAVMLSHHVDHALSFFALAKLRAVQVPVNVNLKGAGLEHVLTHSAPTFIVADAEYAAIVELILRRAPTLRMIWRGAVPSWSADAVSFDALARHADSSDLQSGAADPDLRAILYTSGTTGQAKGVMMTDRMYRAAALGSSWIGAIGPGSVLHFWDPIYHVFGSEVLVMSVMMPITLAFVPRFSASRFWSEVRAFGATHVHFVGGVLQLLLKQPPAADDTNHTVRIAWGGGAPADVWRSFEDRFGVEVREGYGMTETSSFSTINVAGRPASIGVAVDYFVVQLVDVAGNAVATGEAGEIRVAEKEPGVLTQRYFRNPKKTAESLRDGWFYTGDLARQDADGFFYFLGRMRDSLRRRGENISAWEVENVVNGHPSVEECALIGVVNEFQDEDLKLFIKCKPGIPPLEPAALLEWCRPRMASFQIPRFIAFVDGFSKTPTQRIQKQTLSSSVDDCWDGTRAR